MQDPSNRDPRHRRNALRLHVMPALAEAVPDAERGLLQAARRAALEAAALGELARADLGACLDQANRALRVPPWLELGEARRALVLRAWLAGPGAGAAPHSLVERLLRELPPRHAAGSGRWPAPGGWLAVHRGLLWPVAAEPGPHGTAPRPPVARLSITAPGDFAVPGHGGWLSVRACAAGGVAPHRLLGCEARPRLGGEQFQASEGGLPRSLKKQYQQAGVPAWSRSGPLLWHGGQLIFVPGLGVDARARAEPGQPALQLQWHADRESAAGPAGPRRSAR